MGLQAPPDVALFPSGPVLPFSPCSHSGIPTNARILFPPWSTELALSWHLTSGESRVTPQLQGHLFKEAYS